MVRELLQLTFDDVVVENSLWYLQRQHVHVYLRELESQHGEAYLSNALQNIHHGQILQLLHVQRMRKVLESLPV
jgi:hypothetical protein